MKNPLTSKERRGLVAVAAAALLCIGSGFIVRNCTSLTGQPHVQSAASSDKENGKSFDRDGSYKHDKTDKADGVKRKSGAKKTDKRKEKKKKTGKPAKTYPTRDPLSQPCD